VAAPPLPAVVGERVVPVSVPVPVTPLSRSEVALIVPSEPVRPDTVTVSSGCRMATVPGCVTEMVVPPLVETLTIVPSASATYTFDPSTSLMVPEIPAAAPRPEVFSTRTPA